MTTFHSTSYTHLFNISNDGGVIFYCKKDYLVFLSIVCYYAKKYGISIVSMCIMVNHFHLLIKPAFFRAVGTFMRSATSYFTKVYNKQYGRIGQLFKSYGYSQKYGAKRVRTTISYILNNPVEKKICHQVQNYRWNFSAYATSNHPYSNQIIMEKASWAMRKALYSYDSYHRSTCRLTYKYLELLFSKLNACEREQMIDHIVSSFKVIDYKACLSFYDGNYDKMIDATNSNTGSDPDNPEAFDRYNDLPYKDFFPIIKKMGYRWEDVVFQMKRDSEDFSKIIETAVHQVRALPEHFKRFFHLQ